MKWETKRKRRGTHLPSVHWIRTASGDVIASLENYCHAEDPDPDGIWVWTAGRHRGWERSFADAKRLAEEALRRERA